MKLYRVEYAKGVLLRKTPYILKTNGYFESQYGKSFYSSCDEVRWENENQEELPAEISALIERAFKNA